MTAVDRPLMLQLAADLTPDDFRLVVQVFETDMQRLGAALTAAGHAGDAEAWRRSAHAIAGAAAAVGACEVERLARIAMGRTAVDGVAAQDMAAALQIAVAAALGALHEFITSGSSGG